jgi:hypothetical protein
VEVKVFELLAPGTKGAALAVKFDSMGGTEARVAASAGFGSNHFLVSTLRSQPNFVTYDKFHWLRGDGGVHRDGMMFLAHDEIEARWDELTSGDAIDLTSRWDEVQELLARFLSDG